MSAALFNVGIGSDKVLRRKQSYTLGDLQAELDRCREMGATDEAGLCMPGRGSIYLFEVQWIGEATR